MFLIMKHAGKDSDINVCVYIFFCAPFVSKKRQIELARAGESRNRIESVCIMEHEFIFARGVT